MKKKINLRTTVSGFILMVFFAYEARCMGNGLGTGFGTFPTCLLTDSGTNDTPCPYIGYLFLLLGNDMSTIPHSAV